MRITAEHDDRTSLRIPHLNVDNDDGYMPRIGPFGGSRLKLGICMDCGRIQDWKPITDNDVRGSDWYKGEEVYYPTISRAIIEMGFDNGCLSRGRTEAKLLAQCTIAIKDAFTPDELQEAEAYLADLSEEELMEFCCGESDNITNIASEVMNEAFDAM